MSIQINTANYIKLKNVEIDGVEFSVRPLNSAETLRITAMQRDMTLHESKAPELLQEMVDIMIGLFDNRQKAREIMGNLPLDAVMDIYQKIMEAE